MSGARARGPGDVVGGDGRVRVLSRMCATCVFRPAGAAVGPARRDEVVKANLDAEALLTCHATLPPGEPAVCAGFWARHARDVLCGRLAMMIGTTRVDPPAH